MIRMRSLAFCLVSFWSGIGLSFDHNHSDWSWLLKTYINDHGGVDYGAWKNHQTELNQYIQLIQGVTRQEFAAFDVDQQKSFLINAYNALTIQLVLTHYPVKGIKDIGSLFKSPWSIEFFSLLNGEIKNLDTIEHKWLREKAEFKDPRIHAALNCASFSCPPLRGEAFVASKLNEQLNDAVIAWLNDPKRNRFDPSQQTAHVSEIFSWFKEDFGGSKDRVADFLRKYGPQSARDALTGDFKIKYLDYNWSLNI